MMFCRHKWRIVSVAFTEPQTFTFERCGTETLNWVQEMTQGQTHVVSRCMVPECGDMKSQTLPGIHKDIKPEE